MDKFGNVTGHVSEEDVRASLLGLAVEVATVAQQPGGLSEDDGIIEEPFYLLQHFLWVQAGDDGRYGGRCEGILWDLGINTPLEVLDAMDRVIVGELEVDITTLDEVLQTIHDPPVSAP